MMCHNSIETPLIRNGDSGFDPTVLRGHVRWSTNLGSKVLALLVGLVSPAAFAFGLGEIAVSSRLGEPLQAMVPLIDVKAGPLDGACIKVVPRQSGPDEAPWLARAAVRIERRKGGPRLRISSVEAITHPILMLGLQVGCGAELTREYTLLLAPPEIPSRAVASPSPAEDSQARDREPRLSRKREISRPTTPEIHRDSAAGQQRAHQPSMGGVVPADLGQRRASGVDRAETESGRKKVELLAAREDPAVAQIAVEDKIRRMEETLATLREKVQTAENNMTPQSIAASASPAEPKPAEPVETAAQATASASTTSERFGTMSIVPGWLVILLVAAAVGALLIGLRRRRAQGNEGEQGGESKAPTAERPGLAMDFPLSLDQPMPSPSQSAWRGTVENPPQELAEEHRIDVTEHESMLDLAEMMLSFGRVQGAAQTLADYIDANPKQAVRPWLRLLEVYREAGMREEFKSLAQRLHETFNIAVMAWEQKPRRRGAEALERYPHIVTRLVETWNTPECLDYVRHLIHDNRNGTRSGFSAEEIQEILLLASILEENAAAQEQASPAAAEVELPCAIAAEAQATPPAAPSSRPAPKALIHLLARQSHRFPQHPHVPNVVG